MGTIRAAPGLKPKSRARLELDDVYSGLVMFTFFKFSFIIDYVLEFPYALVSSRAQSKIKQMRIKHKNMLSIKYNCLYSQ